MELVKRKGTSVVGRCEHCGREIEVASSNLIAPYRPTIELQCAVKCECGEFHNLIVTPMHVTPARRSAPVESQGTAMKCPKCGSTQFHTGDKGFSLGKAAVGNVLAGPVGLLGGLLGSKKTMITCLQCGYRWEAGRR